MHTPGPWRTFRQNDDACSMTAIVGPKWEYICEVGVAGERLEDDARLIAAAPDLLQALHLVRISAPYGQFADETKTIIINAIAKAEGKQP